MEKARLCEAMRLQPKKDQLYGRCYLKGRAGDALTPFSLRSAYKFRRIPAVLLRLFLIVILRLFITKSTLNPAY
jgi:hypothetical protein